MGESLGVRGFNAAILRSSSHGMGTCGGVGDADVTLDAGVCKYAIGEERAELVLYGCQRAPLLVAGGARWVREWDTACM